MHRRGFDSPRHRFHGSPPYGPPRGSSTPYSSPRFLNPWNHSPMFHQQFIPHYSLANHMQGTPKDDGSFSNYSGNSSSESRDNRWHYTKKKRYNTPSHEVNIEKYVKDSMMENPWLCFEESRNEPENSKNEESEVKIEHPVESNHQQLNDSHLDGSALSQEKAINKNNDATT